jgi:hypothetical protein
MSTKFEEAHNALKEARERYEQALITSDPIEKDGHIRAAYQSLYRAANFASMHYNTMRRKGYIEEGGLLTWTKNEFEIFVDVIYQKFCLKGVYSKDFAVEFEKWSARVRDYVNKVGGQMRLEQSSVHADEWMHRKKKMFGRNPLIEGSELPDMPEK